MSSVAFGPYEVISVGVSYDVVRNKPTVIAEDLRWEEAIALAKALNDEYEQRMKKN